MRVWTELKNRVRPNLPVPQASERCDGLTAAEFGDLFALLRVLTDDESLTESEFRRYLDSRLGRHPGRLQACRAGLEFLGGGFADLVRAEQESRLGKLLRGYPFQENNSGWRKRLRLTSENLDLLIASPSAKRFRYFVVRELLRYYYGGRRGWELVGCENYPGRPAIEREFGHVASAERRGMQLFLVLDDGSYEKFTVENLSATTAGSRPRAVPNRAACQRRRQQRSRASSKLPQRHPRPRNGASSTA